ncbi:AAA family ATPase protein [Bacillus phage PK2]|nr:AAA family ATPase protein [Bacillus phage PK2]
MEGRKSMSDFKGLQIALTGEMRSGKDKVAEYLIEKYGFQRFAFGDGIRKTTRRLFPEAYESGEKPRRLLQEFGQFCVKQNKDVWVNYLFREMLYQGIDPVVDNVVITDLRQPHEYEKLLESGFTIVRVNTKPHIRRRRMEAKGEFVSDEQFNHSTEKHIREFEVDFELDNNGTPDQLFDQVEVMLTNITGGGF